MTDEYRFNEKIRNLRINSGLSKVDMSKIMRVSLSNYSRLESNQISKVGAEQIAYLCEYFNISADYFFKKDTSEKEKVSTSDLVKAKYSFASDKEKKIIQILLDIEDE